MKEAVSTLIHQIKTLHNIGRLKLNKDMKKTIRKIYRAIILKRIDLKNDTISIAGYKLNYLNYWILQYLFEEIFIKQEYYFITTKNSPFIIDCGSNIGMSILYFKLMYPDSRIIAFEPDLDAFFCLKKNVEQNNLQFVEINNKAVSDCEGTIEFYYDIENPGALNMSTIKERISKTKKNVNAVRLSKYINEEVDFLKIDIEGTELSVIHELSNSGKLNFIKHMVIEFHHHIIKDQDMLSDILHVLENEGFGYQISSELGRPFNGYEFQDILIYAYQKNVTA